LSNLTRTFALFQALVGVRLEQSHLAVIQIFNLAVIPPVFAKRN
jgi:hypothetical protein